MKIIYGMGLVLCLLICKCQKIISNITRKVFIYLSKKIDELEKQNENN